MKANDEFLINVDGLIGGSYFFLQTDSKMVAQKILNLCDDEVENSQDSYKKAKEAIKRIKKRGHN